MNRLSIKIKPLIACMAILALIVPALAVPQKAEAEYITGGWLDNIWHIPQLNPVIGATAAETKQTLFQWAQTFVLEKLKKQMLDLMRDQIIQWVQGGGEPKFVTDWQGFLAEAGNVALGELAVRVAGAGICEPFRASILANLTVPEPGRLTDGDLYGSSITCTLDDIVDNIEGFYEDFENGGWAAYSASLEPQNEPIALFVLTQNAKFQTIAAAQHAAELEATTGNGFLSTKSCPENPNSTGADIDRDGIPGDIASQCTITTPGTVIGGLVGKAIGSEFDQIIGADQLSEYIAAITDALWNRLVREGVSGLLGTSTNNAPSGGYVTGSIGSCAGLSNPDLISSCQDYMSTNGGNFSSTWSDLIDDIESAKKGLALLRSAVTDWKEVADDLNTYIAEKAAEKPASCITDALAPYFSDPTPAGVASYVESIAAQLAAIDEQVAVLNAYKSQVEGSGSDNWETFIVTASTVQAKIAEFSITENDIDEIKTTAAELEAAFDLDIRLSILACN